MQKKARKQFAEDKQTKDRDYWNHVLWSDETKINLFGSDGVKRVWRQLGEEYKDKCVLPTVKHGDGSVKVSNIHQLRDVVMEEWKRTPVATCAALVNSMPKRVKAVLENKNVRGVLTSVRYCVYIYI